MVFFILIILIEVSVRFLFPDIKPLGHSKELFQPNKFGNSFGLTPNSEGYSCGAKVITDALGFRVESLESGKIKLHNILILGDSVSFGEGVTADKIFPSILERKLINYGIINASVMGYYVEDYYNVLACLIKTELNFDGIIVFICLNDLSSSSQQAIKGYTQTIITERYPNPFIRLLRYISDNYLDFNSFFIEYSMSYLLIKSLATDSSKNYYLADLRTYTPDFSKYFSDELAKIKNLAETNGKWILFIISPYEYQLRKGSQQNPDNTKPQKIILEIAVKEQLSMLDLMPYLSDYLIKTGLKSNSIYLFDDPMHYSSLGHQVVAEVIYEQLLKTGKVTGQ